MWLAGVPLRSEHVVELARFLALDGFADTAALLREADASGQKIVSLDIGDKGAILRVLESCPGEFENQGNARPRCRLVARPRQLS